MDIYENKKEVIGKILFLLSIGFLIYMLVTPINHFFTHVDEYFTISAINFPFMDMLTILANDVHPPLYYIMAKLWVDFFSFLGMGFDKLFVLKMFSIVSYILILLVSFFKIRKEYGWLASGLFSLSLIVMAEFFAWFLTGRMYGWAILFLVLAFVYYRDALLNFDKKSFALFTIFSAASIYIQYFAVLSVAFMYLLMLIYIIRCDKFDKIKYLILSGICAIILYAPWIPYLFYQLFTVNKTSPISPLDMNGVISAFSFFVSSSFIPEIAVCIILAALIAIYVMESKGFDDFDRFYISSGFIVYLGTIITSVLISVAYKPILRIRYLLMAAAIMWLVLSIFLTKIKDKRRFYISSALILVLLLSGVVGVVQDCQTFYDDGLMQEDVFNQLSQDNSIVIARPSVFCLVFANHSDVYYPHIDDWRGESIEGVHKYFDFKDIEYDDIPAFIKNNTDKDIYIVDWKQPDYDGVMSRSIFSYYSLDFSKVINFNSTTPIGSNSSSKVSVPDDFNVTQLSENSVTMSDGKITYTVTDVNQSMDSVFSDYYQKHKDHKVSENSFDVGDVTVKGLVLEVDGKYVHTNYFFEKNGKLYQIYPQGDENMNLLKEIVRSVS